MPAFGVKTNERPGTRAVVRHIRMSAKKARVVLDLIRGLPTDAAHDILEFSDRYAAEVIGALLDSAIANAAHNDELDPEGLYVSACFADEGKTLYRFRPRARGRATKIRKRTCHITIIVSPMPPEMLEKHQAKQENIPGSRASRRRGQQEAERRAKRVAASQEDHDHDHDDEEVEAVTDESTDDASQERSDDDATEATEDAADDAAEESAAAEEIDEDEGKDQDAAEAPAEAASDTPAVAEGEPEDSSAEDEESEEK